MNARDDATLTRQYTQEGSHEAFRELAMRHGPLVYGFCLRTLVRPDLAEDAAQAVFLVLARKARHIQVQTTLVPWLLATSKRVCMGVLRAERRRKRFERPLDSDLAAPSSPDDSALFDALDRLRDPEREAIVLRFVQGMSLSEIGRLQGISEDAARMRVQRALGRLRESFVLAAAPSAALFDRLAMPTSAPAHVRALIPNPMSTPLILSSSGVAALVVIAGTLAFRGQSPIRFGAATAVAAGSPSGQRPAARTPKNVIPASKSPIPMLDRPFTLSYHLTTQDTRSKSARDAEVEQYRQELTRELDADLITREQFEQRMAERRAAMSAPPPDQDLTISFDGRILMCETVSGSQRTEHLVIDNRTLWIVISPNDVFAGLQDGIVLYEAPIPNVGPSLPLIPLMRGGQLIVWGAPYRGSTGDRLLYREGRVEGGSGKPITRIDYFAFGTRDVYERWVLSNHRKLNGLSVARSIVYVRKDAFKKTYRLTSISAQALPSARFMPESYLRDKNLVNVSRSDGGGGHFDYDRKQGSYKDQLQSYLRGGK